MVSASASRPIRRRAWRAPGSIDQPTSWPWVLATTRADVNRIVRKRLEVRKASFLPMDDAVAATAMEYGGITPLGLPADWPILVDSAVAALPAAVIGSGVRRSKMIVTGADLASLPNAEVIEGLGRPVE